jgi:hypothetical protein
LHTCDFESVVCSNAEKFPTLRFVRLFADADPGIAIDIPVASLDEMTL